MVASHWQLSHSQLACALSVESSENRGKERERKRLCRVAFIWLCGEQDREPRRQVAKERRGDESTPPVIVVVVVVVVVAVVAAAKVVVLLLIQRSVLVDSVESSLSP